ncbi:hypothetical protein DFJ73DRAFT_858892 [Zopfochytrium polystomum]|nr:hypothetical protein DFJ73DRAFT_858892 [Zopfochytrium polystomum]
MTHTEEWLGQMLAVTHDMHVWRARLFFLVNSGNLLPIESLDVRLAHDALLSLNPANRTRLENLGFRNSKSIIRMLLVSKFLNWIFTSSIIVSIIVLCIASEPGLSMETHRVLMVIDLLCTFSFTVEILMDVLCLKRSPKRRVFKFVETWVERLALDALIGRAAVRWLRRRTQYEHERSELLHARAAALNIKWKSLEGGLLSWKWVALDTLATLPFYAELSIASFGTIATHEGFDGLVRRVYSWDSLTTDMRVFRILRILRLLKIVQKSEKLRFMIRAIANSTDGIWLLVYMILLVVVFFSSVLFFVEQSGEYLQDGVWYYHDGSRSPFQSIVDCFWVTIVTLTTTGYGDVFPRTTGGKIVMSAVMIFSIFVIAFPLSMITLQYGHVIRVFMNRKEAHEKAIKSARSRVPVLPDSPDAKYDPEAGDAGKDMGPPLSRWRTRDTVVSFATGDRSRGFWRGSSREGSLWSRKRRSKTLLGSDEQKAEETEQSNGATHPTMSGLMLEGIESNETFVQIDSTMSEAAPVTEPDLPASEEGYVQLESMGEPLADADQPNGGPTPLQDSIQTAEVAPVLPPESSLRRDSVARSIDGSSSTETTEGSASEVDDRSDSGTESNADDADVESVRMDIMEDRSEGERGRSITRTNSLRSRRSGPAQELGVVAAGSTESRQPTPIPANGEASLSSASHPPPSSLISRETESDSGPGRVLKDVENVDGVSTRSGTTVRAVERSATAQNEPDDTVDEALTVPETQNGEDDDVKSSTASAVDGISTAVANVEYVNEPFSRNSSSERDVTQRENQEMTYGSMYAEPEGMDFDAGSSSSVPMSDHEEEHPSHDNMHSAHTSRWGAVRRQLATGVSGLTRHIHISNPIKALQHHHRSSHVFSEDGQLPSTTDDESSIMYPAANSPEETVDGVPRTSLWGSRPSFPHLGSSSSTSIFHLPRASGSLGRSQTSSAVFSSSTSSIIQPPGEHVLSSSASVSSFSSSQYHGHHRASHSQNRSHSPRPNLHSGSVNDLHDFASVAVAAMAASRTESHSPTPSGRNHSNHHHHHSNNYSNGHDGSSSHSISSQHGHHHRSSQHQQHQQQQHHTTSHHQHHSSHHHHHHHHHSSHPTVREVEKAADLKMGDSYPAKVQLRVADWKVDYDAERREDVLKMRIDCKDEETYRKLMRALAEFY